MFVLIHVLSPITRLPDGVLRELRGAKRRFPELGAHPPGYVRVSGLGGPGPAPPVGKLPGHLPSLPQKMLGCHR